MCFADNLYQIYFLVHPSLSFVQILLDLHFYVSELCRGLVCVLFFELPFVFAMFIMSLWDKDGITTIRVQRSKKEKWFGDIQTRGMRWNECCDKWTLSKFCFLHYVGRSNYVHTYLPIYAYVICTVCHHHLSILANKLTLRYCLYLLPNGSCKITLYM